jgi:aryl carrier-like protein
VLVDVVAKLLGVRPSRDGSLIALGLDSIQAIRLVGTLRLKELKVEVMDVLTADTVAGIADIISIRGDRKSENLYEATVEQFASAHSAGLSKVPSQHESDIADILPCTAVQEAMLAETARNASTYCNWILLELPASLDAATIEKALRDVIDSNEILRTGFVMVDDGFAQVIWRASRPRQFTIAGKWESEWSITMGDLLEPPFSATLVKEGNEWKLSVQIHHALYDGWCWEQVLADFDTLLRSEVPATRPQFRKVVEYELSRSAAVRGVSKTMWREALEGFCLVGFPNLHGHTAVGTGVGTESLALRVSRVSYEAAAKRLGVSPQTVVQAAWAFLLGFYVGSTDVAFGTVVSGRTVPIEGIEDVLGPTILTLPVRVDVTKGRKVSDVVSDIARCNGKCMVSEVGLREIRKTCGFEGALFETLLVWQQTPKSTDEGLVKMVDSRDWLEVSYCYQLCVEVLIGCDSLRS